MLWIKILHWENLSTNKILFQQKYLRLSPIQALTKPDATWLHMPEIYDLTAGKLQTPEPEPVKFGCLATTQSNLAHSWLQVQGQIWLQIGHRNTVNFGCQLATRTQLNLATSWLQAPPPASQPPHTRICPSWLTRYTAAFTLVGVPATQPPLP